MPAADNDTQLPFSQPNICSGMIGFGGGLFLQIGADQRLSLIDALTTLFPGCRDPAQISHSIVDILHERVVVIACGNLDGNDLDTFRGTVDEKATMVTARMQLWANVWTLARQCGST